MPKKTNSVDFSYLGDEKLKKGKEQLLDESKGWASKSAAAKEPSASKSKDQLKAEKFQAQEAMRRASKKDKEKVSWKKRVGGIAAILFLCGVGLFQFVSQIAGLAMGTGVQTLSVADTATLKKVLFGGEPWFIYCVDEKTEDQRLPDVLEKSASTLRSKLGMRVGTLRCWDNTESGRSIAARFKLKQKPPLSFVVANGNNPRPFNLVGVSHPEQMETRIRPAVKLDIERIDSLKKWKDHCGSRRACVVMGYKNTAQKDYATSILEPLVAKNRLVRIVTLDTAFWQLKLDEALLKSKPKEEGKRAEVLCLVKEGVKKNVTYMGKFIDGLDSSAASALLADCAAQTGLVSFKKAPAIKARPSKPKSTTTQAPRYGRPDPWPSASPANKAPSPPPKDERGNVDRVGSRAQMESEDEQLFETVEEGEAEEAEQEAEEEEAGEEVEL